MTETRKPFVILMADDDPDDRKLTLDAFRAAHLLNEIRFVCDGEELLDYLLRRGKYVAPDTSPRPGLILLDLNMPRLDGREALAILKATPELRKIPVVILTTSRTEADILRSYDLGANSFVTKPVSFGGLVEAVTALGHYWFEVVALPPPDDRG